jgi:hypothetical protein
MDFQMVGDVSKPRTHYQLSQEFPIFCPCSSGISQLATFVHHPGPVVAPWGPGSDGSSHRRHQAQRLAAPKPLAGHPPGGRLKGQALPPASAKRRRAEFRDVGALEDEAFWSQMTGFFCFGGD